MQYQLLLQSELLGVQSLMLDAIKKIPADISRAIRNLILRGGKQLRPSLVWLSSYMCDAPHNTALYAAAAVEMLHTATLIHDDLIDNAITRRGAETLNMNFTPASTVLSGDITFAMAARFAALTDNVVLVHKFAETLETICEGEINQMLNGHHALPTVQEYFDRIEAKTASLFSLCTEAGAILAGCPTEQTEDAKQFGRLLGLAFQIADDILDIMGSENNMGKPIGSDLREGLITLPVVHYYEQHSDDNRIQSLLDNCISTQDLQALVDDLRASDSADWAMNEANHLITQARKLLIQYPPTPFRNAMEEIATFAVQRRY
jgi:geranylgeranyl pyrophosphate synthase